MSSFDVAGRRRSPATFPEFHRGCAPGNKGMRYPADPPRVEEIVAVMRAAGGGLNGGRIRGLIVVLWRAGLRIQEALDLHERDLDPRWRTARPPRQGRPPARGWDGRVGLGAPHSLGCRAARASARTALLHHRRPNPRATVATDRRALPAGAASPSRQRCVAGSRLISCATPMPSRWRGRASP